MKNQPKNRYKTLSNQLYSGVIYITLLSISLTGILVGLFYWQAFRIQVIESQTLREEATTADLNSWMGGATEALTNFAKLIGYQNLSLEDQITLGTALLQENSAFIAINMYDVSKKQIFSMNQSGETKDIAPFDSIGFYVATDAKETHVGKVINGLDGKATSVIISIPVFSKNSEVIGCMSSILTLKYMQYKVAMIPFERFGYAYILDEQSRIIASNYSVKLRLKGKIKSPDYFDLVNKQRIVRFHRGLDGNYVIGSYKAIDAFQWFFIIEYPVAAIIAKIGHNLLLMFMAFVLSIVLGIWSAKRLYKRIATPLSELSSAALDISNGSFDVSIKTFAAHELGDVATAFNTMSTRLNELFKNLQMRLKYERLVAEISYMFVHNSNNDFMQLIEKTVERIGQFSGADRVFFFFKEFDSDKYRCSSQWSSSANSEILPQGMDCFTEKDFPWMFYQLAHGFPFVLDSDLLNLTVAQLLPEQKNTLSWMNTTVSETSEFSSITDQQLRYQITLPFLEKSELFGLMTLVYLKKQPELTREEIQLFTTLSNVIGNAFLKTYNQQMLEEERERLRITLLSIGDCVLATTADGIIQIINPMAAELVGCDIARCVGKPLEEVLHLVHSETLVPYDNPVQTVLSRQKTINVYKGVTLERKKGGSCSIEFSASPIKTADGEIAGIVLVFRDITEKLASNIEQMRIQKLEAVSFLSAGLVHDFNNLLSSILANITLAAMDIPQGTEAATFLHNAEDTIFKGKDISKQLLSFAKGDEKLKGNSDLNTLLESTIKFILLGSRICVTYEIEKNLPVVNIAAGVVNQVVTNIVINSMQAMNEYGAIKVTANTCQIDTYSELPLSAGTYVVVKISDNGKGISPENLANIFKPYFTTKAEGTGLGLPTVLSVIQNNNGHVTIDSVLGEGTTVTVYFPAVAAKQLAEPSNKDAKQAEPAHIVVLEDDLPLRNLLAQTLANNGITVSATDTPAEVVKMIDEHKNSPSPVSIILMDLSIVGNAELLIMMHYLKNCFKTIRLIACSGYVKVEEMNKYLEMGFDDILPKPFHIDELYSVINKNLPAK